jgi:hypothetical protein
VRSQPPRASTSRHLSFESGSAARLCVGWDETWAGTTQHPDSFPPARSLSPRDSLVPLVKRVPEVRLNELVDGLAGKLLVAAKSSAKEPHHDMGAIGLKTVVGELAATDASAGAIKRLAPKLTAYLSQPVPPTPLPPASSPQTLTPETLIALGSVGLRRDGPWWRARTPRRT